MSLTLADLSYQEVGEGKYVRERFLKRMKKPFDRKGKKKALIIGDSHAQDFYNGVLENSFLSHYQISTRYIPTRCQIYLSNNMMQYIEAKDKVLCSKSDNLLKAKEQLVQADLIILAASWREWAARELSQTIKNMHLTNSQRLIIIGRKSFSKAQLEGFQGLPQEDLLKMRNKVDEHQLIINAVMSKTLSNTQFINYHQLICGVSETCPVFTDRLKQISFDGGHFSKDGARYITKLLFQRSQLGKL